MAVKKFITDLFQSAGIEINGTKPWDIQIHNDLFYSRLFSNGSLGLGESYMDGWWDCGYIDEMICRLVSSNGAIKSKMTWQIFLLSIKNTLFNLQSNARAPIVGKKHYDLGNDLFQRMLDKRMIYSCAYWEEAQNLDTAQEHKLDLICRKLYLKPGMKILDIGCGWGGFAKYAAEKYQARVVGITISDRQLVLAKEMCAGLPVELRLQDYRDVHEKFDRIVSVGQLEHVGYKNYRAFMEVVDRCLVEDGLFLLHTIGSNTAEIMGDPWLEKYIFPNGMLPSISQLAIAFEGLFVMEDWHNFAVNYDKTLLAWHENFVKHWDEIKHNYDQRFFRMWTYYLLCCAGNFRARQAQLWQVVFSKKGMPQGYLSIR